MLISVSVIVAARSEAMEAAALPPSARVAVRFSSVDCSRPAMISSRPAKSGGSGSGKAPGLRGAAAGAAGGTDLVGQRLELRPGPTRKKYAGTLAGKRAGDGAADRSASAVDDGDFIVQQHRTKL